MKKQIQLTGLTLVLAIMLTLFSFALTQSAFADDSQPVYAGVAINSVDKMFFPALACADLPLVRPLEVSVQRTRK